MCGLIDVTVLINDKEYVYTLTSQLDLEKFDKIKKFSQGKALAWLKKVSLKEGEEEGGVK
jgi:hypothetical protein